MTWNMEHSLALILHAMRGAQSSLKKHAGTSVDLIYADADFYIQSLYLPGSVRVGGICKSNGIFPHLCALSSEAQIRSTPYTQFLLRLKHRWRYLTGLQTAGRHW